MCQFVFRTDDGKRPSRKTKETATNLLGLLQGFSTDEDSNAEGRRGQDKDEDSEVGSSSSSETNYLEKHYNAALRREEEKFMNKNKTNNKKPNAQTRSTRSSSTGTKSEAKDNANNNNVESLDSARRKLRSQK